MKAQHNDVLKYHTGTQLKQLAEPQLEQLHTAMLCHPTTGKNISSIYI